MNLTIKTVEKDDIYIYQTSYYHACSAPFDDFWRNGIISNGNYYEIFAEESIGYLVTNDDHVLLQFYTTQKNNEAKVFAYCIKALKISCAHVSTYEPNYLCRCLDFGQSYKVIALFYKHMHPINLHLPFEGITEDLAKVTDMKDALEYSKLEGAPIEWLHVYYNYLLSIDGLYLYKYRGKIIGTGELRIDPREKNISNIGMTVSSDHRKKGLGTYIMTRMTRLSYDRNLVAICGTNSDNIASQKTIEKAGFYPYHRGLEVALKKETSL